MGHKDKLHFQQNIQKVPNRFIKKSYLTMLSRNARNLLRVVARQNPRLLLNRGFHFETYVSGPPRNRISLAEKIVHCGVIGFCFLATPAWVLCHIPHYQGKE